MFHSSQLNTSTCTCLMSEISWKKHFALLVCCYYLITKWESHPVSHRWQTVWQDKGIKKGIKTDMNVFKKLLCCCSGFSVLRPDLHPQLHINASLLWLLIHAPEYVDVTFPFGSLLVFTATQTNYLWFFDQSSRGLSSCRSGLDLHILYFPSQLFCYL